MDWLTIYALMFVTSIWSAMWHDASKGIGWHAAPSLGTTIIVWLIAPSSNQDSNLMWDTHSRNSFGPWVVMVFGGLNNQGMYLVILDSLLSMDILAISMARNWDRAALRMPPRVSWLSPMVIPLTWDLTLPKVWTSATNSTMSGRYCSSQGVEPV